MPGIMKQLLQLYRFLNIISLDVALGAVTGAAFFASVFQAPLLPQGMAALGISVWIIYSVDHLMDVYKLRAAASSERHQFHQKHFRTIAAAVVVLTLLDGILIFYVRPDIFNAGMLLAGVVIFYLLFHRWMYPLKEIAGAVLYSGGVLLPALSLHEGPIGGTAVYLMIPFFITALINLILFSLFGLEQDIRDGHLSLVTFIGKRSAQRVLSTLFLIQFAILALLMVCTGYQTESLVIMLMNIVLVTMFVFPEAFKRSDLYRLAGDVIFLFPLPYLIFHG
jgi:1,4-dihydroxy-2-naphthoate octaprenyltransferase